MNEENLKVKAPKKDYLEADIAPKYESEIEKPRFVNKNVGETDQPHFVSIDKNEDVIIDNLAIYEEFIN